MGFGSDLGQFFGNVGSALLPIPGVDGGKLGSFLGGLSGFKNGGKVTRTGKALVHKGEYVLPANAKPTKAQMAIVAKNKRDAKKKGKK